MRFGKTAKQAVGMRLALTGGRDFPSEKISIGDVAHYLCSPKLVRSVGELVNAES